MTVRVCLITVLFAFLLAGCPSPPGVYHSVAPGQTLYAISKAYGVDETYLARINSVEDPALLQIGQRLYIPGADRPRSVQTTSVAKPQKRKATPSKKTPAPKPAGTASPPSRKSQPSPPSIPSGTFSWPLKGELVKKFAGRSGGPSRGIEIAAVKGTPVLSSAAGRVIYNGNGIRGYGNLIILEHENSFFTVYGFNSSSLVENGAFVGKGERIALSGIPPGGGAPRLHFEIRQGKEPVDPIFYLP